MNTSVPSPKVEQAAAPRGSALRQDTLAALINAVVSVPDGLASAALSAFFAIDATGSLAYALLNIKWKRGPASRR